MPQQVGAYGYAMEFTIAGFEDLTDRSWRVLITRPDETTFERLSSNGDVAVLDEAEKLMGVRIKNGDHTIEGTYKLQVWDETEGSLRSSLMDYVVLNSLSAPTP